MENKDKISKLVKDSFETSSSQSKAPDLWNDLSGKIDHSGSLDNHVKKSFESFGASAPDNSWEKLQNQLDINLVWKRINEDLERKPVFAWWNVAAVLMLLFGSAWLIGTLTFSNDEGIANQSNSLNEISQKGQLDKPETNGVSNVIDITTTNQYLNLIAKIYSPRSDQFTSNSNRVNGIASTYSDSPVLALNENYAQDFIPKFDLVGIRKIDQRLTPNTLIKPSVHITENPEKESRISIGIVVGLNNSWIVDNALKQSFSSQSLVSTSPAFAENYGLNIDFNLTEKSGLISELFFSSRMRQKISFYDHGHYTTEITDINYYKASLLYYQEKWIQGNKHLHQLKFGLGPYIAYNKGSKKIEGDQVIQVNTGYNRLDYGLRFTAGEEYEGRKWIFGYGIQSEVGLKNIQMGQNGIPSNLNVASNLNLGLYLTLRYKL